MLVPSKGVPCTHCRKNRLLPRNGFLSIKSSRLTDRPGSLLGILEAVQEHHPQKYLPPETLEYVAEKTETPLSRIYSVATFYALFNSSPRGTTPSVSVAAPPATPVVRAISCKAFVSSSASVRSTRMRRAKPEDSADHARQQIHRANRGLLRAVRAGSCGRGESSHLWARKRAHPAARNPDHRTGE